MRLLLLLLIPVSCCNCGNSTNDTINYPELAGWWVLNRDYWHDYGTHYVLEFPHSIPDSIEITREQILATLHTDRSYKMRTDGVKRKYTIGYEGFKEHLFLTPGEWFKGNDPYIHFYRSHLYDQK